LLPGWLAPRSYLAILIRVPCVRRAR